MIGARSSLRSYYQPNYAAGSTRRVPNHNLSACHCVRDWSGAGGMGSGEEGRDPRAVAVRLCGGLLYTYGRNLAFAALDPENRALLLLLALVR